MSVGVFSDRKDEIQDGNKILIQQFQSQLSEQLALLHKTVTASLSKQDEQLKDMEEAMQSFIKTKSEVCMSKKYAFY